MTCKHVHLLCLFAIVISVSGFLNGCAERVPDILKHNPKDTAFVPKRVYLVHYLVDPGCGSGGFPGPCVVTEREELVLAAERTYTGWQVSVYNQPNLELHHVVVTNGETPINVIKDFIKLGDGHYSFVLESPLTYMELTVSTLSTVHLEILENDTWCIEIIQNKALVLKAGRIPTGWQVEVYQYPNLRPFEIWVGDGETWIDVIKDFIKLGDRHYSFVLESPLPYIDLIVLNLPTIGLEAPADDTAVNCIIKNIGIGH